MYFILYLADIFTVTNFLHHPQTFNSAKLYNLNSSSKAPRVNFEFGGNLSYFSLFLTDNLSMSNFLDYPQTFKWTKYLTSNMFQKAPRGQTEKVMIFALWFGMNRYGFALFLHPDVFDELSVTIWGH